MNQLSQDEIKQLEAVKGANPLYFKAFMKASEIMPARRAAYSGKNDPYHNFTFMRDLLQMYFSERVTLSLKDIFMFYLCLKFARLLISKDTDSLLDEANYALLSLGKWEDVENL